MFEQCALITMNYLHKHTQYKTLAQCQVNTLLKNVKALQQNMI